MSTYTSDWFSHNIPAWQSFFSGWGDEPRTAIEIGSYDGRSSVWLLENVLRNNASRLHCVDVFADREKPDSYWKRFEENVLKSPHAPKVDVYTGYSIDFMLQFAVSGRTADFVYVDGSHRAADVLEDLILAFRVLKPGGLMICDDYLGGAGPGKDPTLGSPKIAVDAFTTLYRDRLEIVAGQPLYQLAMKKSSDREWDDPASRGAL
ncbi:class I SAM-dependent methyltransferase [Variovorax sp. RTB1]|uniref:class I SAM-dependent methyltransferase n=1 Tax=Variovorax sp. RTB1 TaxID=3048631 RepID=UPI002B225DF0|nr:class I SAM-dependent methyltransferase [Variovorax sp. RTB1]MEB0110439.1 class I SAM-dependent methyltransferase [Variovorax sp. RTB1]